MYVNLLSNSIHRYFLVGTMFIRLLLTAYYTIQTLILSHFEAVVLTLLTLRSSAFNEKNTFKFSEKIIFILIFHKNCHDIARCPFSNILPKDSLKDYQVDCFHHFVNKSHRPFR